MADTQGFKQEPHKLLLIPGPIEVSDDVLYANARPPTSHTSPDFIPIFGDCIRMMRRVYPLRPIGAFSRLSHCTASREVLFTKDAQPFLIAGSGTLGWDQVASNLVEAGDKVLVLNTGYFGDSFADCLQTYGADVSQITVPIGAAPSPEEVESALASTKYKLITITHVDTST
ncbi:hypothetical protein FRB99_002243, partial [Tulasnella sp. 403]